MRLRISIVFILIFFSFPLISQEISSLQDTFIEAEYFFMSEDYQDALPFYLEIFDKMPDNSKISR